MILSCPLWRQDGLLSAEREKLSEMKAKYLKLLKDSQNLSIASSAAPKEADAQREMIAVGYSDFI